MNESKLIKHLPTIGRIFTPAAMLVILTYEISTSQTVTGAWVWAILIGAAATAVGVEAVGILAGHTFEAYWRVGDNGRARLALALLGVYTIAGLVILWGNWALMPIPIIAAVVYLVSGLAESLTAQQSREAANDERQAAFELKRQAKEQEFQHQLDLKKLEADTAVKLARVDAKAVTSTRREVRHDSGNLPGDWRQLTRQQKHKIAHATREEREEMMPELAERTRREWHKRADEIAAQNGHFVIR